MRKEAKGHVEAGWKSTSSETQLQLDTKINLIKGLYKYSFLFLFLHFPLLDLHSFSIFHFLDSFSLSVSHLSATQAAGCRIQAG